MDDEVFVEVEYRADDFVRARRLALLQKLREVNAPQVALFAVAGALLTLFLAPEPFGRIFASAAGALAAMVGLLALAGWLRAGASKAMPIASAEIEVSDAGVVLKRDGKYVRLPWRELSWARRGLGVVVWFGRLSVVVPERALRADQIAALDGLLRAHEDELEGASGRRGGPAAPAEQHDERH